MINKEPPLWDPTLLLVDNPDEYTEHYTEYDEDDIELEPGDKLYYGRNVIWIGPEGKMFRATPDMTSPWKYNAFDNKKITAITDRIKNGETPVIFIKHPYAEVYPVSITEIQEMQESIKNDHFEEDYAIDRPFTTGDDELDAYLGDSEQYLKDNYDEDDWDKIIEEFEDRKEQAVKNQTGDIGSYWVQIRDGNHRVFGAFAAGEPYVYVKVLDEYIKNGLVDKDDLE